MCMDCNIEFYLGCDMCLVRSEVKEKKRYDDNAPNEDDNALNEDDNAPNEDDNALNEAKKLTSTILSETNKVLSEQRLAIEEKKQKLEENIKKAEQDEAESYRNLKIDENDLRYRQENEKQRRNVTNLMRKLAKNSPDKFADSAAKVAQGKIAQQIAEELNREKLLLLFTGSPLRWHEELKGQRKINDISVESILDMPYASYPPGLRRRIDDLKKYFERMKGLEKKMYDVDKQRSSSRDIEKELKEIDDLKVKMENCAKESEMNKVQPHNDVRKAVKKQRQILYKIMDEQKRALEKTINDLNARKQVITKDVQEQEKIKEQSDKNIAKNDATFKSQVEDMKSTIDKIKKRVARNEMTPQEGNWRIDDIRIKMGIVLIAIRWNKEIMEHGNINDKTADACLAQPYEYYDDDNKIFVDVLRNWHREMEMYTERLQRLKAERANVSYVDSKLSEVQKRMEKSNKDMEKLTTAIKKQEELEKERLEKAKLEKEKRKQERLEKARLEKEENMALPSIVETSSTRSMHTKKMHTSFEGNFGINYTKGNVILGGEISTGVNIGKYPKEYSALYWNTTGNIGRRINNRLSTYVLAGARMEPKFLLYVAGAGIRYKTTKNMFVKLEHNFCWRTKYRVTSFKLGVGWIL